jgi:hypothetical protein
MVGKDGLIVRLESRAEENPEPRAKDHTLHVDQLNHNAHQLRKRKLVRKEFRGKRNHLKKEKNNAIK